MRTLALLPLLLAAACRDPSFVRIERLAPGGGGAGNGQMVMSDRPELDILIRLEDDATDFNPGDLMRLLVNGINRTDEVVIGGNYALLRLDPPPGGAQFVELFTRTGATVTDTATWSAMPFPGPALAGVAPGSAREGVQVQITGAGFAAGALRVFFGGVEGTVDASTDTAITATVPAGALPGLLFVLVGADAAEGLVPFQPLDANDVPVPLPTSRRLFAVFPARGPVETPVEVYGLNLTNQTIPQIGNRRWTRLFGVTTVDLPPLGPVVRAFAVVGLDTPPGPGDLELRERGPATNTLPFTAE